jgi:hypothetical protein
MHDASQAEIEQLARIHGAFVESVRPRLPGQTNR